MVLFAIVCFVVVSCGDPSVVGSGSRECKFVNNSSYNLRITPAEGEKKFKAFNVKKGKTVTLKLQSSGTFYFNWSNSDVVEISENVSGRIVFRNKPSSILTIEVPMQNHSFVPKEIM